MKHRIAERKIRYSVKEAQSLIKQVNYQSRKLASAEFDTPPPAPSLQFSKIFSRKHLTKVFLKRKTQEAASFEFSSKLEALNIDRSFEMDQSPKSSAPQSPGTEFDSKNESVNVQGVGVNEDVGQTLALSLSVAQEEPNPNPMEEKPKDNALQAAQSKIAELENEVTSLKMQLNTANPRQRPQTLRVSSMPSCQPTLKEESKKREKLRPASRSPPLPAFVGCFST